MTFSSSDARLARVLCLNVHPPLEISISYVLGKSFQSNLSALCTPTQDLLLRGGSDPVFRGVCRSFHW